MRKPWYRATQEHYGPDRRLLWERRVLVLAPVPEPPRAHRRRPVTIPIGARKEVSPE